jgi:hypothetical protein
MSPSCHPNGLAAGDINGDSWAGSDTGRGFADLLALADAPHLAALLGAGASVGAGLPDWDRLAVNLLRTAGAIPDDETARAYLARPGPARRRDGAVA